ncbi:putative transferase [Medicago truncatula]|uniref:Carbohydrate-binding protein of the ER protein n=1 Tax=Medicago truncatula TaxID=3880 RepID=A0A072VPY1_MEDTR|nr:receptor-like protein 4 [Medicago truncatula]KEH43453.1 carbohydrate-binding protein of the ER protein [Medicago truncatula]RHN81406.1 putative transferase [Medicago truncatula]
MIQLPHFFFSFLIIITTTTTISTSTPTPSFPFGNLSSYHINCGTSTNITDPFNTTWLSDRYYTGGATTTVSEPLRFNLPSEKTLRFFPSSSSGKKNCYSFPSLPSARYLLRTFTVYDNYDAKSRPPSFDVALSSTIIFNWRSPWPESTARDGAYADLFAFLHTPSAADLCFYGFATDAPIISSIELIPVNSASYDSNSTGENFILVNYGRVSCGSGDHWGAGFTNDTDKFGRSWQPDETFRTEPEEIVRVLSTENTVNGTEKEPNYFPMKLYQTAVTTEEETLEYELSVDAKMDYMVWLHFAEIDSSVKKEGERVFDVFINGNNVTRVDIYKEVGSFAAFTWHYTVKNLSSNVLGIKLVTVSGAPLICGFENYALVLNEPSTHPLQVSAMKALKESLRVPGRMGWNGDPCAPTTWDAWEGVSCRMSDDKTALLITEINLGSQGLKGNISDQISLLSDLVTLNLSSNSLGGEIPSGLGQKSLIQVDLSNNQLTGSIPDSLASSALQLVLLNGNLLEGRVPEQLYSVGVHGGAIDLSSNKGLCGVPSLPSCPMFWEHGGLSTRGKIAIVFSCLFVFCVVLLLVYIYIRKKRNDYDFGLPHEIMALAAKRNKYQRQKSLMILELESQHAKGFPSPFTPL